MLEVRKVNDKEYKFYEWGMVPLIVEDKGCGAVTVRVEGKLDSVYIRAAELVELLKICEGKEVKLSPETKPDPGYKVTAITFPECDDDHKTTVAVSQAFENYLDFFIQNQSEPAMTIRMDKLLKIAEFIKQYRGQ